MKGGSETLISILVGDSIDDHVTHVIHARSCLRIDETDEEAHEALQIEAESGETMWPCPDVSVRFAMTEESLRRATSCSGARSRK